MGSARRLRRSTGCRLGREHLGGSARLFFLLVCLCTGNRRRETGGHQRSGDPCLAWPVELWGGLMPKVFLYGYYGFGNLGDELLCAYYTQIFRQYFPGFELVVLTGNKHQSAQDGEAPYTVANRWNLWRLGRMMAPGDLLVGGGGSIFQDVTSKRSLLYYLSLLRMGHRRGVAIILTGQGIGP